MNHENPAGRASFLIAFLLLCSGASLHAATLTFSGTLTGSALENPAGRCAPLISVNASGTGTSNLLGSFSDVQSHCDTGFTTFADGLFILQSVATPADSISGTYSGTASVGPNHVLDFAATLIVSHGTGAFAGDSGTLASTGSLNQAGVFKADFKGLLTPAPEPAVLPLFAFGSMIGAGWILGRRRPPGCAARK